MSVGVRRMLATALVATIAVSALTVLQAPESAGAVDTSQFDPGYIISDSEFYASTSMSEADIQGFLNSKVPVCDPGYTCLKDYRATTFTLPADPMCRQYAGGGLEPAARIIAKVSIACGISPKVLLVMLQKEQGLITDTWPLASQYRAAMGAGCPDTDVCNPAQAGFFLQVYYAAWFLIRYGGPPGTGPGTEWTANYSQYAPGKTVNVLYHPNRACGTRPIYIVNQPTASLYTYTPYTPNAAALANPGGLGDACSSYGNRNFWVFYSNWFGDPTNFEPDSVTTTERIAGVNRIETAVLLSQSGVTATGQTLFLANGYNFPDALSAGPAAIVSNGSLLLIEKDRIANEVAAEIQRLAPSRIVVLGDEYSISSAVFGQLQLFAPTLERWSGIDRYATSRAVAAAAFPNGANTVYIATGENFPDALASSAVAGVNRAPVLLVAGSGSTIDDATREALLTLGPTRIIVAGGEPSVSAAVFSALSGLPGLTVERVAGVDRFATAIELSKTAPISGSDVYIASGRKFPDALSGAVRAAMSGAALLLSDESCIPRKTAERVQEIAATRAIFLGGTDTLAAGVQSFRNC